MVEIMEEAYAAYVADLNFDFSPSDDGLFFTVVGYNNKLPMLIELICRFVDNFPNVITEKVFETMKTQQTSLYYNLCLKPTVILRDMRLLTLYKKYCTNLDKYCCIRDITFREFVEYSKSLFEQVYMQVLIMGNATDKIAIETTNKVLGLLKCGKSDSGNNIENTMITIPVGEKIVRVQSLNVNDSSTIITNYYQLGTFDMKVGVKIELLMMIIEEPLFDTLRTKHQLGYHVYNQLKNTDGILGFTITVHSQANKFEPTFIDNKIEQFLKDTKGKLKSLTESRFEQYKKDLIKIKELVEIQLEEEVDKFWVEIIDQDYNFNRNEQEVKFIKKITLDQFKKWFKTICNGGSDFRKLSVQVVGNVSGSAEITVNPEKLYRCSTRCIEKNSKCARFHENPNEVTKQLTPFEIKLLNDANSQLKPKKPVDVFVGNIEEFKNTCSSYIVKKNK